MSPGLNIVSVCRSLPTPDDPSAGVFVLNRLAAMSEIANVRVIQPVPYLPVATKLPDWARATQRRLGELEIVHAPMPYVPGVLKSLDGMWLARAIAPIVDSMHAAARIDILDAHFGYPDGAGCMRVARRLNLPVFITLRGFEQERVHEFIVGRELITAMRRAVGCVAVSHTLAALAVRSGVDPQHVRVVHNAIDSETFHSGDRAAARKRLMLAPDQPLVVSVGHLISRKRHHVLIDAFAELRRQMPDAALAILGARSFEPRYPDQLISQVRALELEGAVRFVGNLPQRQVVDWLLAADAFVLLSAREGCCNAVLEALAVGVPVVATGAGDNAVFVQPGINGDIVPLDDAPAVTRSLMTVLNRKDWNRRQISEVLISQVGSWQVVAERVIGFFNEMLAKEAAVRGVSAP